MKQFIAAVFFDILSYTIGIFFCIFKNFELNLIFITARVYKPRLAEANFLSCYTSELVFGFAAEPLSGTVDQRLTDRTLTPTNRPKL